MVSPPRRVLGHAPGPHAARNRRVTARRPNFPGWAARMRVAALACATAALFPAIAASAAKIDVRLLSRWDDAVEAPTGSVVLTDGSYDIGDGGGKVVAGIRWRGLAIPAGSTITSAYVVFTSSDSQAGPAHFEVQA